MKKVAVAFGWLALATASFIGVFYFVNDQPWVLFSGGELRGEAEPVPSSWDVLGAVEVIQFETAVDGDRYSVNIWAVAIEDRLYIAGNEQSNWAEYARLEPRVRVRINSGLFELQSADNVGDDERKRVMTAYISKYGVNPEEDWLSDVYILRLTRRLDS